MSVRCIITRGDDAGCCVAVNLAVVECVERGLLRNVSVQVCGPAFADAARRLRELRGVCLGLHVCLSCEWSAPRFGPVLPPSRVPSLVDAAGGFLPSPAALHERSASLEEMEAEIRAQLQLGREAGLEFRYLDEHMGVGWILGSVDPATGAYAGGLRQVLRRIAVEEGLIDAEGAVPHLPLPARQRGENTLQLWSRALSAEGGSGPRVLFSHPAVEGPDLLALELPGAAPRAVAEERVGDYQAWLHPELAAVLRCGGWKPARYDEAVCATAGEATRLPARLGNPPPPV